MKVLIIGGNRFVGLRLALMLDRKSDIELHILNRTGQVAHVRNAIIHKGDRNNFKPTHLDQDFDLIFDFATYTGEQARASLDYFKSVGRYIFVSTASVYNSGHLIQESAFDPSQWQIANAAPAANDPGSLYQFGKRHAESIFMQQAPFPTLLVRFPFILGPDDYTNRLSFHIQNVEQGLPIFFPNILMRTSFVSSDDAARFLFWSMDQNCTGPINVASPEPISMQELMKNIEAITGKKAYYAKVANPENSSPYGDQDDWTLAVTRMEDQGFKASALASWLQTTIQSLAGESKSVLH